MLENTITWIQVAYRDRRRDDGSPAYLHPVAVMEILQHAEVTDEATLTVALLHDILEDTTVVKDLLTLRFGLKVAQMVEMLSYTHRWSQREDRLQEMLLNLVPQLTPFSAPVLLIKMADRLHNLQTMHCWSAKRQQRYLQETKQLLPTFRRLRQHVSVDQATARSRLYRELYAYCSLPCPGHA